MSGTKKKISKRGIYRYSVSKETDEWKHEEKSVTAVFKPPTITPVIDQVSAVDS